MRGDGLSLMWPVKEATNMIIKQFWHLETANSCVFCIVFSKPTSIVWVRFGWPRGGLLLLLLDDLLWFVGGH